MMEQRRMMRGLGRVVVCLLLSVAGCATEETPVAPVSGKVMLDGEPVANAKILFAPLERDKDQSPGPIAHATTDENGQYALANQRGTNGAAVGKNQVWISTRAVENDPNEPDKVVEIRPETVPNIYNSNTELIFIVPPQGSDHADFELTSAISNQRKPN